jgi:hypothetical protein
MVEENDGHGVFQDRKGGGAKKQHGNETDDADCVAVFEKYPHLLLQNRPIARNHHPHVRGKGPKELLLVYEARKPYEGEDRHGHD